MKENNKFQVSVVIPVYNAEQYLHESVLSALNLSCVGEIILIDDGSTDSSFSICSHLALKYDKIKLLTHKDRKNEGAAKSRNLGILASKFEYVAFLDADDYFLENRFELEKEIFSDGKSIYNGVCGATGCNYASEEAFASYSGAQILKLNYLGPSCNLWWNQSPTGHAGTFSTNAITVKKDFLIGIGLFDESLRVSQDTELWIRIGLYGNIYVNPDDSPLAIRNVYVGNRSRMGNKIAFFRPLLYSRLLNNCEKIGIESKKASVYSTFFMIHYLKATPKINRYNRLQIKELNVRAAKCFLPIILNLFFIFKFFFYLRPKSVVK